MRSRGYHGLQDRPIYKRDIVKNVILSYLPLVAKQYIRLQNGCNFFIAVFDAAHDGDFGFFIRRLL
jgi:hypothetical protein